MSISKANRKKYNIRATTPGYPELELALYEAVKKLGWKAFTCHIVGFCNTHQPKDTPYSIPFWKPKRSPYKPPKMATLTEVEYRQFKKFATLKRPLK